MMIVLEIDLCIQIVTLVIVSSSEENKRDTGDIVLRLGGRHRCRKLLNGDGLGLLGHVPAPQTVGPLVHV
jgi:hypothetical protein